MTWERFDVPVFPNSIFGPAPYGGTKHTRWARRTVDGCWYVLGGDFSHWGLNVSSSGSNLLWKVTPGKPFKFEQLNGYLPQPGKPIPNRVDEAPWAYDSKRDRFLLFPFPRWTEAASADCVVGHLMFYYPKTNTWVDLGSGRYTGPSSFDATNNPQFDRNGHQYPINRAKWGYYDEQTDKYYIPTNVSSLMVLDAETLAMEWPIREIGVGAPWTYYDQALYTACLCFDKKRRRLVTLKSANNGDYKTDPNAYKLLAIEIDTGAVYTIPSTGYPFDPVNPLYIDFEALVHDEVNDQYLLYGGCYAIGSNQSDLQPTNDLRALPATGGEWVKLMPTGAEPPRRYGQTMHFDPTIGSFFALGGINDTDPQLPEMWFPNLATLQQRTAIRISGTTWSPRRDNSNVILATEWPQLPANSWVSVDASTLSSVIPRGVTYVNANGNDGTGNIVAPWSGAAWDSGAQIMYLQGGGHGDTHPCETEVVSIALSKLTFVLEKDRQSVAQGQSWNETTKSFQSSPLIYSGYNVPLKNGVPGAMHSYWGLVHIPGSVWGNSRGALSINGAAKAVLNLDTGEYTTTSWYSPTELYDDWGNQICMLDGKSIWRPHDSFYVAKYALSGTQATTWSTRSFGVYSKDFATMARAFQTGSKFFSFLEGRREMASFAASGPFRRLKLGAAIDSGAKDWSNFVEDIALTSSDGSHLHWNATNLASDSLSLLGDAGAHHDATAGCIWVCPNKAGAPMYKLTGLEGNTWTVTQLPRTTAPLTDSPNGTFGRFRVGSIAGIKVAIRVAAAGAPIQVMRLS